MVKKSSKSEMASIKKMLEQYNLETVQEAINSNIDELRNKAMEHSGAGCGLLKDPGKKLKAGEDRCISKAEMLAQEAVVGDPNFLAAHFLTEGAEIQRAVGRIALTQSHAGLPAGSGWGTGFMVSPTLLLTNNHVIPDVAFCQKVKTEFNYQLDKNGNALVPDTFQFNPSSVFHTNAALDYTLVRLKSKSPFFIPPFPSFPVINPNFNNAFIDPSINNNFVHSFRFVKAGEKWGFIPLNPSPSYASGQRVNIIQHPAGRRKEVALQANEIQNTFTNVIRYTTDTQGGSSGSPVFNNFWDLVALHHAGSSVSNEGIRIDKIVDDLRAFYGGSSDGRAILNELGI